MANISGYTPERLAWEREKALIGYKEEQFESLSASITKADTNITAAYSKLSAEGADNKREMISAVSRFQGQQQSGLASARVKAIVELRKLMLTSKIDFAKAAYAPDEAMLRDVRTKANPSDSTNTKDRSIAEKAWQLYYTALVPGAGNEWGTYQEMVNTYGSDTQALGSKGGLEEKRTRLKQELIKEQGGHADFNQAYGAVEDIGTGFEKFLEDNPLLDPNDESTYVAFENDVGIREQLPRVRDTAFIKQLQKAALDVDTGRTDLYRTDALAGIKAAENARDRDVALRNAIVVGGGDKATPSKDTDRDLMAAWLKRPDVQEWARKNGLRVGRVVEVTEQQKADIAAGKIPASTVTKYGMLTDGPDDQKAVNFAYKQMARTPERDLFRSVGITRSGLSNTPIEVEIGVDPALYKDPNSGKFYKDPTDGKYVNFKDVIGKYTASIGVRDDGWISTLPDGTFVWSTDSGKSWAPVSKDVGTRLSEKVTMTIADAVVGLEVVDTPPPVQVFRGVARPSIINDAAGSVRFVDESTGEEVYANPDIIRRVNEPGVRSDASKPSLAKGLAKATARGALKKTGLGQDESDMDIGEKPAQRKAFSRQYPGGGGASVQARRERSEMLEALPTVPDAALDERFNPRPSTDAAVAEYTQRAKMSDTTGLPSAEAPDSAALRAKEKAAPVAEPGRRHFVPNEEKFLAGQAQSRGSVDVTDRRAQPGVTIPALVKPAEGQTAADNALVRTGMKPTTRTGADGSPNPKAPAGSTSADKDAAAGLATGPVGDTRFSSTPRATVDATTPSPTTPTAGTDAQRAWFKNKRYDNRYYKKDAEGNPEP